MKSLLLAMLAATALAADAPISAEERAALIARYTAQRTALDERLRATPDAPDLLSHRGDARLFLGDAAGAVADFEREIALEPARDTGHWRLGIAYHFAGQFEKSAAQFAKYHAYDARDRENGVWHFLGHARVVGVDKARTEMLKYTRFDRDPFPAIYELLAGKKTAAEVLAELDAKKLGDDPLVMFFAHYYIGLNADLLGDRAAARTALERAVPLARKAGAGGGPGYMGEVARLHCEQLAK